MKISLKCYNVKVSCKANAVITFSPYLIMKRNFYRSIGTIHTLLPMVKRGEVGYSTALLNSQGVGSVSVV